MRVVLVALMIALIAGPAFAQRAHGKRGNAQQSQADAQKKKKAAEADKAYKASLGKIPDQKPTDPWGNMR